jgi:predicted ATPase
MSLRDLGVHRLKDLIRPEHIFQVEIPDLTADFPALKTLDSLPNNLPMQLTSFVGREKEIGEIKKIMEQARLVTLTGTGGSGKTRLALKVAADLIEEFSDGVWSVDLAPLSDPSYVPQTIASALSLRQEGGRPLMDLLAGYVRRRNLLIVLDNCEHIIEACARAADQLLHAAPRLKILATSREGLRVAGERTFSVPTLSLPDTRHLPPLEALTQYEAVDLFIDRALAVNNDFAVTATNAPAVVQICHRLDGVPLAIELAAARVQALSPEQIAARLDDSFRLLTVGSRTAIPRHQTLRAVVDWSWELLPEDERKLLRRLSILAGGWTLEAAEAIGAGEGIEEFEVLDLLTQLVSKSLVIWQEDQNESRYYLLETIRQYALGKLLKAGEDEGMRQRHAEFFAQWTEQATSEMYGPRQAVWIKRIDTEQDNLRVALEWAVGVNSVFALRIANALADNYWSLRGAYAEGSQWYERALPSAGDVPLELRAYALAYATYISVQQGQITPHAMESLDLARQSQDKTLLVTALGILGSIKLKSGDLPGAAECFEEALPLAQEVQSPRLTWILVYMGWMRVGTGDYVQAEDYFQQAVEQYRAFNQPAGLAPGLWNLGDLAFLRGDYVKARADLTEGLRLAQELQDLTWMAHISETLGRVCIVEGNLVEARSLLDQSLLTLQDIGMRSCLAHNLEGWARLAVARGDPQLAVRLLSAINSHLTALGMSMIPLQQALYDQTLSVVQQQLDLNTFQAEWVAGEQLDVEKAIALLAVNP